MAVHHVKLVGQVAGGREHIVAQADVGDPVLLIPERDNPFDPSAVAVYHAPRKALLNPAALVSSVKDPAGVGQVDPTDRLLFLDRQAGYLPREFAATIDPPLPESGIVGVVDDVRYGPVEWAVGPDGEPEALPPNVVGFDILADLPAPGRNSA